MPVDAERLMRTHDAYDPDAQQATNEIPSSQVHLAEVARGLNATVRLVQALHHEVKEFAIGQATLRLTIASMEETMKELRKAITTTDPSSLTIRLVLAEREVADLKEWKKEQEVKGRADEQERMRTGWQFKAVAATAAISFFGSLLMFLLNNVVKH